MEKFMNALLEASIAMSVIALMYIAITPILRKMFTAKGRYYAWLVIIIGLIIPFRFHPQVSVIYIDKLIPIMKSTSSHSVEPYVTMMSSNIPWSLLFCGLWLVGVTVFITIHLIQHIRFLKVVKRWSTEVVDPQMLKILHDIQAKLKIKQPVDLRICPGISSPMLLGIFHSTILLPPGEIPEDELPLIFKHELVHCKRRDIWYKTLVFLATALHWFNPFVYMIAREISIHCELSCDEEVVKDTDIVCRKKYVEAIIGIIRKQSKEQSKFSTNFYSRKQGMKHRIFSIMDTRNKKWGFSILAIIVVATLSTSMMVKISTPESSHKYSILASENESDQKSLSDEENTQIHEIFHKKDKPVHGKKIPVNDMSSVTTEVILLMEKNENIFEVDIPKLVERK
ncbi:M56 family metallopeptidase [Bacillus sp. FJAT-49705]|uniref:M56 family metallopeptidase n=1 Tax=Cytobacillus citreus TaxID=2833586 RepID=A0ABS5NQL7_9BACI|nr:M56 family metallopeptidase [Cytobacillus citreus]MBS4189764.1 M56 family metallopeptidase [Cytobacillus citreus]